MSLSLILIACSQVNDAASVDVSVAQQDLAPSNFAFCGSRCGPFYVGYGRSNVAQIDATEDSIGARPEFVLPGIKDAQPILKLQSYRLDERRVELENGTRASIVHRLETVKIGSLRKSETLVVEGSFASARTQAEVRLVWGDTLVVRSRTLASGSPVKIKFNRTVGGFGSPLTSNSFYDARANSAFNGQVLTGFAYADSKATGGTDVFIGTAQDSVELEVRIGVPFTLEGELRVVDGVVGISGTTEQLNGADASDYTVTFSNPALAACLRSESGVFAAGSCN
jgi:hypothetical protein